MGPKDADGLANSVDPDQTAPPLGSDLGLHCLPRPICPKTLDHYGSSVSTKLNGMHAVFDYYLHIKFSSFAF